MQVKCIRAFGRHKPGDLAEVPDGAAVDPYHWEPAGGGSGGQGDPPNGGDGGTGGAPRVTPTPTPPAFPVTPVPEGM